MSPPVKEPPSYKYFLWIDVYDLINCDEVRGKEVWAVGTIGNSKTEEYDGKYKAKTDSITWAKPQIK